MWGILRPRVRSVREPDNAPGPFDLPWDKRQSVVKARRAYSEEVNDPALRPSPRRKRPKRRERRAPGKPGRRM